MSAGCRDNAAPLHNISLCPLPSFISPRSGPARPQLCPSNCRSVCLLKHYVTWLLSVCPGRRNAASVRNKQIYQLTKSTRQLRSRFMFLIYVKWIESVQAFCLLIEAHGSFKITFYILFVHSRSLFPLIYSCHQSLFLLAVL